MICIVSSPASLLAIVEGRENLRPRSVRWYCGGAGHRVFGAVGFLAGERID
jgi:hypothetical protein